MNTPAAKDFKDMLKNYIKESTKTSYGKNELIILIEELYSAFLDDFLERNL